MGTSNQVFAALLAHLAEVDARGLHRTRACASLYTYCIYELRMSEDAAARRAGAAKLVKRFPLLLEAIARGELHLTGLLLLGRHLTLENIVEVLGRAKFRTKKELTKLVRELHPLPLVPDLVEPLRPAPRGLRRPTSEEYAASLAPAVRELSLGERPQDWANDTVDASENKDTVATSETNDTADASHTADASGVVSAESFPHALARVKVIGHELPPITAPRQYQVQFSTNEEHVRLIERARALLSHQAPGKSLGELHLEAMRLLVASLEKQKFAVTKRASDCSEPAAAPLARPANPPNPAALASRAEPSRYIPAAIRRAVYERDDARCTYVDGRGERCQETHYLELHHRQPFAQLGAHSTENLTLYCRAHNALAAETDFGREYVEVKRRSLRHEPLAAQPGAAPLP